MGNYGSKGGLFMNAPLKKISSAVDDAKVCPNLRGLNIDLSGAGLGKTDLTDVSYIAARSNQRKVESR
jgi:hypothetical protein